MELLAGAPDYITSMRENSVTLHLDISKVYCNPRLGERPISCLFKAAKFLIFS